MGDRGRHFERDRAEDNGVGLDGRDEELLRDRRPEPDELRRRCCDAAEGGAISDRLVVPRLPPVLFPPSDAVWLRWSSSLWRFCASEISFWVRSISASKADTKASHSSRRKRTKLRSAGVTTTMVRRSHGPGRKLAARDADDFAVAAAAVGESRDREEDASGGVVRRMLPDAIGDRIRDIEPCARREASTSSTTSCDGCSAVGSTSSPPAHRAIPGKTRPTLFSRRFEGDATSDVACDRDEVGPNPLGGDTSIDPVLRCEPLSA